MDTSAFSEGLARLYAEFAQSLRENDSDSVRNAYKELRNSGRPISEILDEAIRTIGISYEELEKHLLGVGDSQPAPASQAGEPSILFGPHSPEPGINSDNDACSFVGLGNDQPHTTGFALFSAEYHPEQLNSGSTKLVQVFGLPGAIFSGFYARLGAWALVIGTIGTIAIAGLMTLPISLSTSKPAAVNKIVAGPVAVAAVSAASEHAPALSSPAPSTSVGPRPSVTTSEKSNQQIVGAVTAPGSATKPDADTSSASAETGIAVKAEAVTEHANVAEPTPKAIGTSAAGPEPLSRGGDRTPSSTHVQNGVNAVQAAQPVTEAGAKEASKETGVALNVPGPTRGGELSADPAWLLARGDTLFRIGDVTSARGFYERAAENGNGRAALRLGESYDPSFLQQAHLASVRADTSAAIFWYRRARDLGVTEAQFLLRDVKGE